jgi:hypothetical protein
VDLLKEFKGSCITMLCLVVFKRIDFVIQKRLAAQLVVRLPFIPINIYIYIYTHKGPWASTFLSLYDFLFLLLFLILLDNYCSWNWKWKLLTTV